LGRPRRGRGAGYGRHAWQQAPGNEPDAEACTTPSSGVSAKLPARYDSLCPAGDSGGRHQDALSESRRRKYTVTNPQRLGCPGARVAIERGGRTPASRGESGSATEPPLRSRGLFPLPDRTREFRHGRSAARRGCKVMPLGSLSRRPLLSGGVITTTFPLRNRHR